MVQKTKLCIGVGVFLLLVGIALVVFGVIIQDQVDSIIEDKVTETLQVTAGDENDEDEDWQDFLFSDNKFFTYRAWEVANPTEWMRDGDKPIFRERGPYRYQELDTKYNVEFKSVEMADGSSQNVYGYNSWWKREMLTTDEWTTDGLANETTITVFNPSYQIAMSGTYAGLKATFSTACPGTGYSPGANVTDFEGCFAPVGVTATSGIQGPLSGLGIPDPGVSESFLFLSAGDATWANLKLWYIDSANLIPITNFATMFGAYLAKGVVQDNLVVQWAFNTDLGGLQGAGDDPYFTICGGIGGSAVSSGNCWTNPANATQVAQAAQFLDTTNPYSLVSQNTTSYATWMMALEPLVACRFGNTTACDEPLAQAIFTAFGGDQESVGRIAYWLAARTSGPPDLDAGTKATNNLIAANIVPEAAAWCAGAGATHPDCGGGFPAFTDYEDVGAFAFTSGQYLGYGSSAGNVTSSPPAFPGPPAPTPTGDQWQGPDMPDFANSDHGWAPTLPSLTWPTYISVGIPAGDNICPPPFGGDLSGYPSFAVAKAFITTMANEGAVAAFAFDIASKFQDPTATTCPTITDGAQIPWTSIGINSNNALFFTSYINSYLPYHLFYDARSNYANDQYVPFNSGLLTKRTVEEILYGYTSADVATGIPFPGFFSRYDSLADHQASDRGVGPTFAPQSKHFKFTGEQTTAFVGAYYQWRGIDKFQYSYKTDTTENTLQADNGYTNVDPANCIFTDHVDPDAQGGETECQIWAEPEQVTWSNAADAVEPFQEDGNIPVSYVFTSEGYRVLRFIYREPITYKGIKMRRYTLARTHLYARGHEFPAYSLNENGELVYDATTTNDKYQHTLNGTIPMFRTSTGNPVWLSRPYFWEAESEFDKVTLQVKNADGDYVTKEKVPDTGGLNRDTDDIDILIYIEPLSGRTMFGYKALQLNFRIPASMVANQPAHRNMFNNINSDFFLAPIVWVIESGEIADNDAEDFKDAVYGNRDLADTLAIVGLALGIFTSLVAISCIVYFCKVTPSQSYGMDRLQSKADLN